MKTLLAKASGGRYLIHLQSRARAQEATVRFQKAIETSVGRADPGGVRLDPNLGDDQLLKRRLPWRRRAGVTSF